MLFSTNTRTAVKKFGLKDGIKLLAEAGFTSLDLSIDAHLQEIKDNQWQPLAYEYKEVAQTLGIGYSQAHAVFGGGKREDGTSRYVTERLPYIPACLEFAAMAGVETVVVHPQVFLEKGYLGHEQEHFEKNMEFFSTLAPIARDLGIKIAIENLWTTDENTGLIVDSTCADPLEHKCYFDTLNRPDVFTLCLDVGHTALCGRKPEDAIRALGHDRLGALHIHDVDCKSDLHTLPYLAGLNWEEICRALGEIDYSGVLTLEADSFCKKMDTPLMPDAVRFMAKVAKHLSDKVDQYRQK